MGAIVDDGKQAELERALYEIARHGRISGASTDRTNEQIRPAGKPTRRLDRDSHTESNEIGQLSTKTKIRMAQADIHKLEKRSCMGVSVDADHGPHQPGRVQGDVESVVIEVKPWHILWLLVVVAALSLWFRV